MRLSDKLKFFLQKGLRLQNRSFLFLHRWASFNPAKTVFAFLVLIVLALTQIPNIRGVISIYELLPDSFPSLKDLRTTDNTFQDGRNLTFAVTPKANWDEHSLCELRKWISQERLSNIHISRAFSALDLRNALEESNKLLYPRLISLNCESPNNEIRDFSALADSPWSGSLLGKNLKTLLVQFDFLDTAVDQRTRAFSSEVLKDILNRFKSEVSGPLQLETRVLGNAPYESYLAEGNRLFFRVNLLLFLLFLIFFRIFVGTWRSGVLYLIALFISLVFLLGLMGATGGSFDILANSLIVMVSVANLQDFVYPSLLRLERNTTTIKAFMRLIQPGFYTTLTTVVGFGSLGISSLPMVRDFGLYAAFGSFVEWVVVFFFLPAFIRLFPYFDKWVNQQKAWGFKRAGKILALSQSKFLKYHFVAVFVLLLPLGLRFYDEPKLLFPHPHQFRQDTESFVKEFGWEYTASLVFPAGALNNKEILKQVSKSPYVLRVESPDEGFEYLTKHLTSEMRSLAQMEYFKIFRPERYFGKAGAERVHLYLKTSEISEVSELRKQVNEICKHHCYISGPVITYGEFVSHLAYTLFESLFVSLLLVTFILWLLAFILNYERPWILIYSALWGPSILLILIMVLRIPINMMTSLTASIVLGLTGDNAIEFIFARKNGDLGVGLNRRFSGALVTCIMMAASSMAFLFSPFDPPKTLGVLFGLGLLLSFFGDYFVLRFLWEKNIHR